MIFTFSWAFFFVFQLNHFEFKAWSCCYEWNKQELNADRSFHFKSIQLLSSCLETHSSVCIKAPKSGVIRSEIRVSPMLHTLMGHRSQMLSVQHWSWLALTSLQQTRSIVFIRKKMRHLSKEVFLLVCGFWQHHARYRMSVCKIKTALIKVLISMWIHLYNMGHIN